MINIKIIAVGSLKEKYLVNACAEYIKRMEPYCSLNVVEVPEFPIYNAYTDVNINRSLECEGKQILKNVRADAFNISLCIEGRPMTSQQFSEFLNDIFVSGNKSLSFIIGGSEGLSEEVKRASKMKLSFSSFTFPHQLMRVLLLEQIYRSFKINRNEPYHK